MRVCGGAWRRRWWGAAGRPADPTAFFQPVGVVAWRLVTPLHVYAVFSSCTAAFWAVLLWETVLALRFKDGRARETEDDGRRLLHGRGSARLLSAMRLPPAATGRRDGHCTGHPCTVTDRRLAFPWPQGNDKDAIEQCLARQQSTQQKG